MISKTTLSIKEQHYGGQVRDYDQTIILKSDIEELYKFIQNKVSLKSFKGKVVFLQDTTFPRFKLTEYSKKNNKIVRTIKNSTADAVIIDVEDVKAMLKSLQYQKYIPINAANLTYQRTGYYYVNDKLVPDTIVGLPIDDNNYYSRDYQKNKNQIEHLIELYNNYPNIKIITAQDLTQEVSQDYEAITADWAEKLDPLLGSPDMDSVKLGMTFMTNANFEDSLLYNMLLYNKHIQRIQSNPYFNSVNFRSFRDRLHNVGYLQGTYGSQQLEIDVVKQFLKMKDKNIYKSQVAFVEKLVRDNILGTFTYEQTGFKLDPDFKIKLNIDPSRIIDDELETIDETQETVLT